MRFITILCASAVMVAAACTGAYAGGAGVHGAFGFGGGTASLAPADITEDSVATLHGGGGLVFDTNLMGAGIFNYRIKLGGDYIRYGGDKDFEGAGGHILNYFGFRLFRSSRARLWLGPMLGLRYIHGEFSGLKFGKDYKGLLEIIFGPSSYSSIWFGNFGLHRIQETYNMFGMDLGLTFGMNFALTEVLVLGVDLSGKYMLFIGKRERDMLTLLSISTISPDFDNYKEDVRVHSGAFDISVSIMFRFGEGKLGRR